MEHNSVGYRIVSEPTLQHHGVFGMRWGVRNSRRSGGPGTAYEKKLAKAQRKTDKAEAKMKKNTNTLKTEKNWKRYKKAAENLNKLKEQNKKPEPEESPDEQAKKYKDSSTTSAIAKGAAAGKPLDVEAQASLNKANTKTSGFSKEDYKYLGTNRPEYYQGPKERYHLIRKMTKELNAVALTFPDRNGTKSFWSFDPDFLDITPVDIRPQDAQHHLDLIDVFDKKYKFP